MQDYNDFNEAYEITKTLEIVTERDFNGDGGPSTIRIEVLQSLQTGKYSVRWSEKTNFHVQPSYPIVNGVHTIAAGDYRVWVALSGMPWVDAENESLAISQALGFLKDRGA